MSLRINDTAPDFTLPAHTGAQTRLYDLLGERALVLFFYPKDNTAGCTREAVDYTRLAKKFQDLGVTVIGVSKDTVASHDKFKSKHKLKLTLASDSETALAQAYGVWIEKNLYGRKSMGMERATFLIDGTAKIRAIWRKVKVDGHAEAVLAAVKDL